MEGNNKQEKISFKDDEPILWEGTCYFGWKILVSIVGFILLLLLLTLIPYIPLIIFLGIYAEYLILPVSILSFSIFLVIDSVVLVLRYKLNRFDQYIITSKNVIIKRRLMLGWGKLKTQSYEIGAIQHVLRVGTSFNFYTTKCEDSDDFADFYMRNTSDPIFYSIDTPDELLNVLQSIIPLRKEHPCTREWAFVSRYDRVQEKICS